MTLPAMHLRARHAFVVVTLSLLLGACGGGGGGDASYTVTASAGAHGQISPDSATVNEGASASFTVTPDSDYDIDSVTGCGGTLSGNTYTTGPVTADCSVTASFVPMPTVTAVAESHGSISPGTVRVSSGQTTSFTVTPDSGYKVRNIQGCGGSLNGNIYTTGPITAHCTVNVIFRPPLVRVFDAFALEDKGILTYIVELDFLADGDVSLDYAISDGTATTADNDYSPVSGTLTINSGTLSTQLSVPIHSDTTVESDETIMLNLSNVSANVWFPRGPVPGTILNDEATGTLNDTGVTLCGDYAYGTGSGIHSNRVDCASAGATFNVDGTETGNGLDPVPAGQDALYGRDATHNDSSDGVAGFVFSKIYSDGTTRAPVDTRWDCVLDRVTGLMWEVKTDDGGLRDWDHTYTWYNSDIATNGGDAGTANGGSCYDSINCDTEKYVAQVNASGLCGYTDWRMPNPEELSSVATMGKIRAGSQLDRRYFSSLAPSGDYWALFPESTNPAYAWSFSYFGSIPGTRPKSSAHSIRLVRTNQ